MQPPCACDFTIDLQTCKGKITLSLCRKHVSKSEWDPPCDLQVYKPSLWDTMRPLGYGASARSKITMTPVIPPPGRNIERKEGYFSRVDPPQDWKDGETLWFKLRFNNAEVTDFADVSRVANWTQLNGDPIKDRLATTKDSGEKIISRMDVLITKVTLRARVATAHVWTCAAAVTACRAEGHAKAAGEAEQKALLALKVIEAVLAAGPHAARAAASAERASLSADKAAKAAELAQAAFQKVSGIYYANLEQRKAACEEAVRRSQLSANNAEKSAQNAKNSADTCVKICCGLHVRRSVIAAQRAGVAANNARDFEQKAVKSSCWASTSRAGRAATEAERFRLIAAEAERKANGAVSKIAESRVPPLHLWMLHNALLELSARNNRSGCPIVAWLVQQRQRPEKLVLQLTAPGNIKLFQELRSIAPNVCELLQHLVGSSSELYGDGSCLAQLHAGLWKRVKATAPIKQHSNAIAMLSLGVLLQLLNSGKSAGANEFFRNFEFGWQEELNFPIEKSSELLVYTQSCLLEELAASFGFPALVQFDSQYDGQRGLTWLEFLLVKTEEVVLDEFKCFDVSANASLIKSLAPKLLPIQADLPMDFLYQVCLLVEAREGDDYGIPFRWNLNERALELMAEYRGQMEPRSRIQLERSDSEYARLYAEIDRASSDLLDRKIAQIEADCKTLLL